MAFSMVVSAAPHIDALESWLRELDGELTPAQLTAEVIVVVDDSDDPTTYPDDEGDWSSIVIKRVHIPTSRGQEGRELDVLAVSASSEWLLLVDGGTLPAPSNVAHLVAHGRTSTADITIPTRSRARGQSAVVRFSPSSIHRALLALLARVLFPVQLRRVRDPFANVFLARRSAVSMRTPHSPALSTLLAIVLHHPRKLAFVELPSARPISSHGGPLPRGDRVRTSWSHLIRLRFSRFSAFTLIGAAGAIVNLGVVALLTGWGVNFLLAALIAAELTIIGNYFLQERFAFADLADRAGKPWLRFMKSFGFNNVDALARIPVLWVLVSVWGMNVVFATALTLAAMFLVRYFFHVHVVYAPRREHGAGRLYPAV